MMIRNQRGNVLIEFALVFPFLLVLTLSVVDLSRAFFVKNLLYQAAREGARSLVVSSAGDTTECRERVNLVLGAAKIGVKRLAIIGPSAGMMTVQVDSDFKFLYPGLFQWLGNQNFNRLTLRGAAVMRRESL